jgi:hypothetical protein
MSKRRTKPYHSRPAPDWAPRVLAALTSSSHRDDAERRLAALAEDVRWCGNELDELTTSEVRL